MKRVIGTAGESVKGGTSRTPRAAFPPYGFPANERRLGRQPLLQAVRPGAVIRVAIVSFGLSAASNPYDGKGKAWVRFADDGRDAIVGGSRVERL
jgi:hypothetical protein